jgi:hypothetical protein
LSLYQRVLQLAPAAWLELAAPLLLAYGFAPGPRKAPEALQRKAPDPLQPPLQRKAPRKRSRKGARPKYGTAAYWLARLDRSHPHLAGQVRSGTISANAAAIAAGMRKSHLTLVAST